MLGSGQEVSGELAGRRAGLRPARCPWAEQPLKRTRSMPTHSRAPESGARGHSPQTGPDLCPRHVGSSRRHGPRGVVSWVLPPRTLRPSQGDPPATSEAVWTTGRTLPCHTSLYCVFLPREGSWPPCVRRVHRPHFRQLLLTSRLCRIFTILTTARLFRRSCICR